MGFDSGSGVVSAWRAASGERRCFDLHDWPQLWIKLKIVEMAKRKMGSEEHLHRETTKRKRPALQLSSLPTDVLCLIVSKLPIKEAVRTSVLSSYWRHRWCCHSNLAFSLRSMFPRHCFGGLITASGQKRRKQEFIERVDVILQQHSGQGIENIKVHVPFNHEYTGQIERWVNFAVASKTKQITFNFSSACYIGEPCIFDLRLLNDSDSVHLQSVKLSSVFLKLPADFKGFQNLRRLHLADTNIADLDLQLLISNCNVLELLGLADCRMLTRLQISYPSNSLKHLQVHSCLSLQVMELNIGLVTLEYSGPLIPLSHPGTSLLTNICIKLQSYCPSLEYIFTKFPSTVPCLEMLILNGYDLERATLPGKIPKFVCLRHLQLELTFHGSPEKKTDALDFACLLVASPFLEKLEFHMWMACEHQRYSSYSRFQGKLRRLPSQPHSHLRLVDITGFYGQKDQLELALHILRNCAMLEAMTINPKPVVAAAAGYSVQRKPGEGIRFLDGYRVAWDFLQGRGRHRDVVRVREISYSDTQTSTRGGNLIDPFRVRKLL